MRSLADDKAGFLRHTLTTTIDGYQIVVAATLDIERDDCRIVDDDRTDVQTVRSHRSKTDAATLRNDDRSAIREIVCRRTCWRGNNQSISLISNEKFAIYLRTDGNQRSIITLQYGDIVEGERIAGKYATFCLHLNHRMLLYQTITGIKTVQRRLYLAWQHIGKEAQSAHIHTDDRRTLGSHTARRLQEGTITTHRDDVIHIKVVILEHPSRLHIELLVAGKKLIISILHINFSLLLFEIKKDFLYRSRLLSLVFITKYCEF